MTLTELIEIMIHLKIYCAILEQVFYMSGFSFFALIPWYVCSGTMFRGQWAYTFFLEHYNGATDLECFRWIFKVQLPD